MTVQDNVYDPNKEDETRKSITLQSISAHKLVNKRDINANK